MVRLAPVCCVLALACACAPTLQQRRADADGAIKALQSGAFAQAEREAAKVVEADAANPFASAVHAIARYKATMHQLSLDLRTLVLGALPGRGLNQRYLEATLGQAEQDLAAIEADLAVAAAEPDFSLELCLACWEVDWNGSGRIERFDRLLLEIEQDEAGRPLPEGDPRRRPTCRFDVGDVAWARAFVSFQRAALDVVLAFDWSELGRALERWDVPEVLTFPLVRRERIDQARALLLAGLDQSDQSRRDYLAETDDDREWLPNPRQKDHPMPLPVDEALYATWEALLGDLRRLVRGEQGLDLREVVGLVDPRHRDEAPEGAIDVGGMLSRPKDIVLDLRELKKPHLRLAQAVAALLGPDYLRALPASPMLSRLARMKGEVDRGEEKLERKLRYLFWVN